MAPELFILAVLLLLLGTIIPLAAAGKDRRLIRTISHLCTIAASAILIVLALIVLITTQGFSWTAYQPFELFSIAFVIDRLAAFFLLIASFAAGIGALLCLVGFAATFPVGVATAWHLCEQLAAEEPTGDVEAPKA